MKPYLIAAIAGLILVVAFFSFRSQPPSPADGTAAANVEPPGAPSMRPSESEASAPDRVVTDASPRAALEERLGELRVRRESLSKKMESIEQRLAEKGNAAGPTHLEEAKAALLETLEKEEMEAKYLQATIDNPPTPAAANPQP
jgi:hypothetical protein